MKLGEILIRYEFVTQAQLDEGLSVQITHGGRIGSNLAELGYISVNDVARALGQQHNTPAASDDAFRNASQEAIAAVKKDICERHCIFPLALADRVLHLAMRDPQHLALIEKLNSTLEVRVKPYASPEVRILQYLERVYKIPRPRRYQSLKEEKKISSANALAATATNSFGATQSTLGSASESVGKASVPMAPKRRVPVLTPHGGVPTLGESAFTPPKESADEFELVYLDEATSNLKDDFDIDIDTGVVEKLPEEKSETLSDMLNGSLDRPKAIANVEEIIEALEHAEDRESIIRHVLRPIDEAVTITVLLLPKSDIAVGLSAYGSDIPRGKVRQLVIPLNVESVLNSAFENAETVLGPSDSFQMMIANYLQAKAPKSVCVAPVVISGKVINLLCSQSDKDFSDNYRENLAKIAKHASNAYKRLILKKRSGE